MPRTTAAPRKLVDLIKLQRQKRAIGAKFYQQADELLSEILTLTKPGKRIPMGNGLFAVVVDAFADGGRAFKPVFMQRYELQIVDVDGKQTRIRDAGGRRKKTF